MIVLGINEDHNATAAVVRDGVVVACASEERFTRLKNDTEYPKRAIDAVLEIAGVRPSEIDGVAVSTLCSDALQMRTKRVSRYTIADYVREMREHWHKVLIEKKPSTYWKDLLKDKRFADKTNVHYDYSFMETAPESEWPELMNKARRKKVVEHLGVAPEKVHFIDHHKGHAYYAYHAAPHDKARRAAVVTADGWGDGCNATVSVAEGGRLKEIFRTPMCNLARIYRWMTLLLGMKPNEHEYKVMGLAPYAKDYVRQPAYDVFKETLVVDGLDFKWKVKPSDMYFHFRDKLEGVRFDGIAGGLQMWLEELVTSWVGNILAHTKTDTLYYSGGLSMNVKANKALSELAGLKEMHVPSSGGDESLAMGAAFVLCESLGDTPAALKNVYLGTEPRVEDSRAAVASFRGNAAYAVIENPTPDAVADWLVKGKVIGRCVGRMEFGARSLGNRAILCDPSKFENLKLINEKIKFRDFWMPFTPSILLERSGDYIVNPKGLKAEYMTMTFDSTPLGRVHLKAAIHPCDFTVRPQLVSAETNPDYHALLKAFEKRTGVGALLNTSLNLHGSPIVRTAEEAIDTLMKSGLDGMLLPGLLFLRTGDQ